MQILLGGQAKMNGPVLLLHYSTKGLSGSGFMIQYFICKFPEKMSLNLFLRIPYYVLNVARC